MSDTDSRVFKMLHERARRIGPGDTVAEPMVTSSMFLLDDQPPPERTYGRVGNPTVEACESRLSILEGARSLVFPSGMGAYGAVAMATLSAGDKVLLLSDGYYAARNLITQVMGPFGVTLDTVAARDVADHPVDGYRLVIIETPSNPTLDVVDIAALADRCKAAGALLAVDNTVMTPIWQNPIALGADIIICADTKSMGGHSDLLLGHVSTQDEALFTKLFQVRTLMGPIPGAFEAWLLARGLDTLEIRLSRMGDNAQTALPLFADHAAVAQVYYPARHPQARHQGFLLGIDLADKAAADRFIATAGCFVAATSFGGVHSSADRRARWGDEVGEGFLRLSFGVEPTAPLIDAIKTGLAAL